MADFTKDIIKLVQDEKNNYEQASQEIREKIKRSRKNYSNTFDQPKTSKGRTKTFIPMTRWEVDTVVPKIFVNDKAITVLPENETSVRPAFINDKVLKHQMRETRFPMQFRNSIYDLGIDGTTVWAIYWDFEREVIEEKGISSKLKKLFRRQPNRQVNILKDGIGYKQIDILNVWIDPLADSIQDAPSFIYRNVTSLEKVKRNRLYTNVDKVKGFKTTRSDSYNSDSTNIFAFGKSTVSYEQPMVNVYERWGKVKGSWITGKKKDSDFMVDAVITIADLDDVPVVLRVDKNPFTKGKKPFEECWYQKKQGRWYGIGTGEKLIELQTYLNKTVNRREENEDVLHSGVFKKKRGSGLSVKNIQSVPGGVIEVDQMGDLEQLQIRDISQLSNGTVNLINGFVERITGANEIAIGSAADRSATTSLIKDRNSDTRFAAVRGYINDFLIRFFNQWLERNEQFIDRKFTLRISTEDSELGEVDNLLGISPEQKERLPGYRFIDVEPKTLKGNVSVYADIDQSIPQNKAENAERILKAIDTGKRLELQRDYEKLFDEYLDNIGLQGAKFKERKAPISPTPPIQQAPSQPQIPTELDQFQQANDLPTAISAQLQ